VIFTKYKYAINVQKKNIQTSAGVRLTTPTLLTAAVISLQTAFFRLPFTPLFKVRGRLISYDKSLQYCGLTSVAL